MTSLTLNDKSPMVVSNVLYHVSQLKGYVTNRLIPLEGRQVQAKIETILIQTGIEKLAQLVREQHDENLMLKIVSVIEKLVELGDVVYVERLMTQDDVWKIVEISSELSLLLTV